MKRAARREWPAPGQLPCQVLRGGAAPSWAEPQAVAPVLGAPPGEEQLRRGDRGRRGARSGRRVLPGRQPRDHRCGGPGQGIHRVGRLRAQHRDPAVELPDARGRPVLRPVGAAVPAAGDRTRLQRDVLAARAPDPGAQRRITADDALARRSEQGGRSGFRGHRPGRGQAAGAVPRRQRGGQISGAGGALPSARWHHPARRGRLGIRPRRLRPWCPHPPEHRGHRHRRGRRPGARGHNGRR